MKVTGEQARRFLVARQLLAPARTLEGGPDAVLEVIRQAGLAVDALRDALGAYLRFAKTSRIDWPADRRAEQRLFGTGSST